MCVLGMAAIVEAKVATISLDELARKSTMIVLASVESLEVKAGVRIAHIKPIQTIRGKTSGRIAFVAEQTWKCDMSTALKGERVLLYLSPIVSLSGKTMYGQDLSRAKESCENDGTELLQLSHSGRGRIPLHETAGQWLATISIGDGSGPSLNVNLYLPWPKSAGPQPSVKNGVSLVQLMKRTNLAIDASRPSGL